MKLFVKHIFHASHFWRSMCGIRDREILKIVNALTQRMHNDQSWNVKLHAANILVWYGQEQGLELIEQAIQNEQNIQQEISYTLVYPLVLLGL